jgi:hypothetical protein
MLTAMVRAAHLLWDDPPKIFEDTFALALSGCANEAALRERLDAHGAELAEGPVAIWPRPHSSCSAARWSSGAAT